MGRQKDGEHTVRMPYFAQEAHGWRRKGIVFGELQLSWEDTAFVGGAFWPLDQSLPGEEVIFGYGARSDTFWGIVCESAILL
jgi:hypothetical protein